MLKHGAESLDKLALINALHILFRIELVLELAIVLKIGLVDHVAEVFTREGLATTWNRLLAIHIKELASLVHELHVAKVL